MLFIPYSFDKKKTTAWELVLKFPNKMFFLRSDKMC